LEPIRNRSFSETSRATSNACAASANAVSLDEVERVVF
jgi:hypothetical protein